MIRLEGVRVARAARLVLDRASLAVGAGEVVAVQGGRAAGKSALAEVAACVWAPDAGSVVVGGRDVLALQRSSLPFVRRNIGFLPQAPPLVGDETVLENVVMALGPRGVPVAEAVTLAASALEALGLAPAAPRLARALSAGERQLVALARALVGPPPLVVLDDPSAGLDAQDGRRVVDAVIAARGSGCAVLCVSADAPFVEALAARGARRAKLEDGRLQGGAAPITLVGATAPRTPAATPPSEPDAEAEPRRR